ncbi:MAG TPA: glycosyltransferase family 2 protein, partial [Phototrophicaceae bacterium]|nr:glycosyltransferase family 2 protein [Phototrophicaceae bacterium]
MPLTALVITKNESAHIEACLRSVDWADERLVIDSGSTDDTAAIAARCGATVLTRAWDGYSNQKNFGTSRAKYDWILSIDADERVSPGLAAELLSAMASPGDRAGFRIPRVTFYLGRWIRCTDWYPDLQLRLYDRRRARWNDKLVHESVTADGPVGELRGDLEHFAYRDISHHLDTINKYTTLAADEMRARGRTTGFAELLLHPPAAFLRNYILKRGVTAGTTGLVVSILNSYHVFLKYAKLWA